jgi:hypothetical protein
VEVQDVTLDLYNEDNIKDFMNYAGYQGLFSNHKDMKPILKKCYGIFRKNSKKEMRSEKEYYV